MKQRYVLGIALCSVMIGTWLISTLSLVGPAQAQEPRDHGRCVGVSAVPDGQRFGKSYYRVFRAWEDGHVEYYEKSSPNSDEPGQWIAWK